MDDLISRKAAIESIDNFSMEIIEKAYDARRGIYVDMSVGRRYTMTKEEVKDLINALPPAQPEQKIGKGEPMSDLISRQTAAKDGGVIDITTPCMSCVYWDRKVTEYPCNECKQIVAGANHCYYAEEKTEG